MAKFRVTLTRLIEEECIIYVDAKNEEEAAEKAVDTAEEVSDLIWERTETEPHTYGVDEIEDASKPKEFKE